MLKIPQEGKKVNKSWIAGARWGNGALRKVNCDAVGCPLTPNGQLTPFFLYPTLWPTSTSQHLRQNWKLSAWMRGKLTWQKLSLPHGGFLRRRKHLDFFRPPKNSPCILPYCFFPFLSPGLRPVRPVTRSHDLIFQFNAPWGRAGKDKH